MSTFAERLALALKESGLSQKELEEQAPLSKGYASRLLEPRGKEPRPGPKTIARLAKALKVRQLWLADGTGPMRSKSPQPGDRTVDLDDVYPNRARAILAARNLGTYEEEDIQAVLNVPGFSGEEDPSPDWWLKRIERAREERLDPFAQGARLSRAKPIALKRPKKDEKDEVPKDEDRG